MKTKLFVLASILALGGCGDTITGGMVEQAQKFCKERGGVDYIETFHAPIVDALESTENAGIRCRNGENTEFSKIKGQ